MKTLVLLPCTPPSVAGRGDAQHRALWDDVVPGSLWKTSDFVVVWLIPPQQVTVCPRAHGLSAMLEAQRQAGGWGCHGPALLTTSAVAFVSLESEATRGWSETPSAPMSQPERPPQNTMGEPGGGKPHAAKPQHTPRSGATPASSPSVASRRRDVHRVIES